MQADKTSISPTFHICAVPVPLVQLFYTPVYVKDKKQTVDQYSKLEYLTTACDSVTDREIKRFQKSHNPDIQSMRKRLIRSKPGQFRNHLTNERRTRDRDTSIIR